MNKLKEAIEAGRIRRDNDGYWQVHTGDSWVTCENEQDALALDAIHALYRLCQRKQEVADATIEELEVTVRACELYGVNNPAYRSLNRWLKKKKAKGASETR
ncbi:MAG: hypothetical protein IH984_07025 [Planctomycetes bacterium]|nr:hypothetical protein [Planctomycetota bacterium]